MRTTLAEWRRERGEDKLPYEWDAAISGGSIHADVMRKPLLAKQWYQPLSRGLTPEDVTRDRSYRPGVGGAGGEAMGK